MTSVVTCVCVCVNKKGYLSCLVMLRTPNVSKLLLLESFSLTVHLEPIPVLAPMYCIIQCSKLFSWGVNFYNYLSCHEILKPIKFSTCTINSLVPRCSKLDPQGLLSKLSSIC